jgi:hypothetical protein
VLADVVVESVGYEDVEHPAYFGVAVETVHGWTISLAAFAAAPAPGSLTATSPRAASPRASARPIPAPLLVTTTPAPPDSIDAAGTGRHARWVPVTGLGR